MSGLGLGWLVLTLSLPIPVIRPIAFVDDDYGDVRRLEPSMDAPEPCSTPKTFAETISIRDNSAGSLPRYANCSVNVGAPSGLVFRPHFFSPPPTMPPQP